jgi:aspartate aminotransferase-like enzyme
MKRDPLVMIPGPTPVDETVLRAMSVQTYGHTYGGFVKIYKECLAGLKTIFNADHAIAIGGAGTLSMEMGLVNVAKPGDKALMISQGYFGDRYPLIAKALGIEADVVSAEAGRRVCLDEVESRLRANKYAAMTLTHVDTSSGTLADLAAISALAKKYDVLFILDGVCASAAIDEDMKKYGIDVIVTTCQKAFAVPPGMTILAISDRAINRREELGDIRAFYADWKNWLPIMGNPGLYFATPPVNHVVALGVSVASILEEGLPRRFARHEKIGRSFRAGVTALGLEPVTVPEALAPTLTVMKYPAGIDDAEFRAKMEDNGIFCAGGVGSLKGKVFRVGHMGSIGWPELARTMTAIELTLAQMGYRATPGAGTGAMEQEWAK